MSADLTADEEKLVRAVVDTARTQGKPTPKPRLDRIIRDDAAERLLVRLSLLLPTTTQSQNPNRARCLH